LADRRFGVLGSLASGSLSERKWHQARGDQQKQIKRASEKMRFNRWVDAVHRATF
jgi:hypothetical protein